MLSERIANWCLGSILIHTFWVLLSIVRQQYLPIDPQRRKVDIKRGKKLIYDWLEENSLYGRHSGGVIWASSRASPPLLDPHNINYRTTQVQFRTLSLHQNTTITSVLFHACAYSVCLWLKSRDGSGKPPKEPDERRWFLRSCYNNQRSRYSFVQN